MTDRCTYPVPAQRLNARVDLDTYASGSDPRWRAVCGCGWECGGYVTGVDAWRAIDKHRTTDRQLALLEDESRTR